VPFALPIGLGAKPSIGSLRLTRSGTRVDGVRFAAGSFLRGDPAGAGTDLSAVGRLTLELMNTTGATVKLLTPPGGAQDLLPGEYAYTLPETDLSALVPGSYRFRARAYPVSGGPPSTRLSASFTVP
jgi:hypothetical protein